MAAAICSYFREPTPLGDVLLRTRRMAVEVWCSHYGSWQSCASQSLDEAEPITAEQAQKLKPQADWRQT